MASIQQEKEPKPTKTKPKPLKAPNGHGTVYKLHGRRRKPWVAKVTSGWTTTIAQTGGRAGQEIKKQLFQIVGYFEKKEEAINALALHRITPVSPKTDISLGDLYKEWAAVKYTNISKATGDNYRAAWLYVKHLEKAKFKDLRTPHWQSIINKCAVDGLSLSTLKKIKTVIGMLYGYALQNDIVNKNYGQFITLPRSNEEEKERFNDFDIDAMFKQVDQVPWVDTILIMIYSGMRISEMLELTKFNVDLKEGIITGGLKTDAGKNRVIPIHPKILPYIKQWYDKGGEALICNDNGKALTSSYYRRNKYYPALEVLGIKKLTPHACRHTFASLMARAKVDPLYTQRIIGHADYAFTANKYTHPEVEELRKAIDKI